MHSGSGCFPAYLPYQKQLPFFQTAEQEHKHTGSDYQSSQYKQPHYDSACTYAKYDANYYHNRQHRKKLHSIATSYARLLILYHIYYKPSISIIIFMQLKNEPIYGHFKQKKSIKIKETLHSGNFLNIYLHSILYNVIILEIHSVLSRFLKERIWI